VNWSLLASFVNRFPVSDVLVVKLRASCVCFLMVFFAVMMTGCSANRSAAWWRLNAGECILTPSTAVASPGQAALRYGWFEGDPDHAPASWYHIDPHNRSGYLVVKELDNAKPSALKSLGVVLPLSPGHHDIVFTPGLEQSGFIYMADKRMEFDAKANRTYEIQYRIKCTRPGDFYTEPKLIWLARIVEVETLMIVASEK